MSDVTRPQRDSSILRGDRADRGDRAVLLANSGGTDAMAITAEDRHARFAVRRTRRRHDRLARPRLGASGTAPGGDAREGPRHLAGAHLGSRLERCPRRRPRPPRPRRRAGRPGVDPFRGSAGVGRPRHRHRGRAGHHRRPVSDQPGGRGGVPARRLRLHRPSRRGPGAGRQGVRVAEHRRRPAADRLPRAPWTRHLRTTIDSISWDELLELGAQHRAANPGAVERRMAEATDRTTSSPSCTRRVPRDRPRGRC